MGVLTSVSASERTQIHAARRRNPSSSYIRIELGFSFTILRIHVNTNEKDDHKRKADIKYKENYEPNEIF